MGRRRMMRIGLGTGVKYDARYTLYRSIIIITITHLLGKTQWGREELGHDDALRAKRQMPRTPQKCATGYTPPRGVIGGAIPDTATAGSSSSASSTSSGTSSNSSAARTLLPPRSGGGRETSLASRPQLPAPQSVMAMEGGRRKGYMR